jgi:alpha-tubulin suppressor-like RCC1 family protein
MHSNEPIKLTKDRVKVKDLTLAVALAALANLVARGSSRLIEAMLAVCCLAMMNDACRAAGCDIFPSDAIAYWRFDNNLNDSSGGGHTLIPGTGTSFRTGKALQAGESPSKTANFATAYDSALADYARENNQPWTWVGWYRRNANVYGFRARLIQLKQSNAYVRGLEWDVATETLRGNGHSKSPDGFTRGATASLSMPYTIGEWYFIVYGMEANMTETRVFVEVNRGGRQYATIPTSGSGVNLGEVLPARIQLGGDPILQESCDQSFDEIGIYDRLLSASELDALYNNGISRGFASPSNLSGGWDHSLAVKHDGTVWSWGGNSYGQLARTGSASSPGQVTSLAWARFNAVACGGWHSLALKEDGGVWAWGYNYYGQLGDGSTVNTATPTQVKGLGGVGHLSGVIGVAAGSYNSYALKADGTVWAWGNGLAVGNGPYNQSTPVQVLDTWDSSGYLTGVIAISGGDAHCLALKSDRTVRAWGYNSEGQLGNNTVNNSTFATKVFQSVSPTPVELSGVASISAGGNLSVALKCDGTVWTWGGDNSGALGNGLPVANQYLPAPINLGGIRSISAGWDYCLATDETGSGYGWGRNHAYQLGLGDSTTRYSPVWISTLPVVDTLVAAKMSHSFGMRYDWKVLGWGANSSGQVGDGTMATPKTSPVLLAPSPLGFGL